MKKVFFSVLTVGVIGMATLLFVKTYQGMAAKKQTEQQLQHLPSVALVGLDSTSFALHPNTKPIVIFYFDPHCEHCQNEANALKKQANAFENVTLLWLSTERLWVLREFEQKYGLQKTIPSLKIAHISPQDADKQFGFRTVPTILMYDTEGNLTKKYVGETKIEAILKHLHGCTIY
ncbi:TlpA family protein disulfide reductase [Runella sp.]|uniref:TlpA family protein disulfide reductase n=1 Tax=Runella sp. TaxID=1960881 RepID=UPI003D10FBEF